MTGMLVTGLVATGEPTMEMCCFSVGDMQGTMMGAVYLGSPVVLVGGSRMTDGGGGAMPPSPGGGATA